ncbi:DUF2878 domain-containing protein [Pseudocolwellia sp. HL-MZ19]|uniref:DUF2878 domain-containing protein n=1 Tax=Pseudocolwellia sp. HL-MZ19 TaxID=3400846 RepID=UPI003CF98999
MRLFSLINLAIFQLSWFLSATYQESAIPIIIALMCLHFLFSPCKKSDIEVLPIALVGIVVDQLLMVLQVIQIPQSSSLTLPIWLLFLWCVLAWCFNHSLKWLSHLSLYKVSGLGAVFGTLSYYAALQLNVFSSAYSPLYFIVIMAVVWALLLPFLTRLHTFIIESEK